MNQKKINITLADRDGFEYRYELLGTVYSIYYVVQPEGKKYREVIRVDNPDADISSGTIVRDEGIERSVLDEFRAIEEAQKNSPVILGKSEEKQPQKKQNPGKSETGEIEIEFSVPHKSDCSEYKKEKNYYDRSRNHSDSACRELEREKRRIAGGPDKQPEIKLPRKSANRKETAKQGKLISMLLWLIIVIIGMGITTCDSSDDYDYGYDDDPATYTYLDASDLDSPEEWLDETEVGIEGYAAYIGDDYITVFVGSKSKLPEESELVDSEMGYKVCRHSVIVSMVEDDDTLEELKRGQHVDVNGSIDSEYDTATIKGKDYNILKCIDVMGWSWD